MRIFLTGATGFVGSHIVPELLGAGHDVLGLARSDAGAAALAAAGAEVHRGDIENLDSLRRGADACDAVIHAAFDHDFAHFAASCAKDGRAIAALGEALAGSARPLLITSGVQLGVPGPGQMAREDHFSAASPNPRVATELAGSALLERGVNLAVLRLAQIHDTRRQGLVTELIKLARDKGCVAYVGEGNTCWSAAHVADAARLYRLAIEGQRPGERYHASAEEAIPLRDIAAAVGERLGLPVVSIAAEEAQAHFGWLSLFTDKDMSASSSQTRARLGWAPRGPGLLDSLRQRAPAPGA